MGVIIIMEKTGGRIKVPLHSQDGHIHHRSDYDQILTFLSGLAWRAWDFDAVSSSR